MLRMILSADRRRNSGEVIERICAAAEKGVGGQILIVPEQYSHTTERELCAAGGDSISRYAEVLSLTRLASRLFSIYGGVCEEYLDKGGRLLSVYLAAEQVRSRLKYYAAVSTKPEFLGRLGAAMEEFMSCCLTPEALKEASERVSGQFAQKLEELALLYESYLSVCKTGRSDPVTRLERLCMLLRETDYAAEHTFYLDGFSDFTAIEREIVTELLRRSPGVTVALCTDGSGKNIFRAAERTRTELKKAAARWNVPVETARAADGGTTALDRWRAGMFSAAGETIEDSSALALHQAQSVRGECEYAAWRVRSFLRAGARCRDIGIALSSREVYAPMMQRLFARMGIPAYFAGNDDILRQPLFAAVLAALEAVERYEREKVLAFLKSGFAPLDADGVDRVEKYAFTWDIHALAWEEPWTMHPDGYGAKWDEESQTALAELERLRAQAVEPLRALRRALRAAQNVGQMMQALDEFLAQLGAAQIQQARADALEQAGEKQAAQQARQLYDILILAMEQTYQVLGACVMEPEQLTAVFRMLLSQYQAGTIPATVDQVQIGAIESFRSLRVRHLIVLGAEEGRLPSFSAPLGVFTEEERQRLLAMGLSLAPAQEERLDRELGWIHAALSAAEQSCALCYSGAEPSFLFTRSRQMFPTLAVTTEDDIVFATDTADAAARLLRTGESAAQTEPALQKAMRELAQRCGYTLDTLERGTVRALYGKELSLSASRIDRFAACRYAFFLYDGLRARPWKQARFDAPLFGTFVHYVLEKTVKEAMERGGFATLTDEEVTALAQKHAAAYTGTYLPELEKRGARAAYLFARNVREATAAAVDIGRELRASDFVPRDCELRFAADGKLPPVEVETPLGRGVLSGMVDRVDLYETAGGAYYRVIDYKTGRKDMDYAGILCGEGLQMLIYLFALKEHGAQVYGKKLFPAGVLYVPAREDMERIEPGMTEEELDALRAKHKRRKGLLLKDEALLQAMEHSGDEKPRYLPYQMKKDGLSGDLATREQMTLLEALVRREITEMTGQILAGQVEPNPILRGPMRSSCMYCDFARVCHKDACRHENRYIAEIRAEQFWQEAERRMQNG